MNDISSAPILQKTCVLWSHRRERDISLRVYYDLREQDGCKVFTIDHVEELA
jgi:hypothetical protein